MRLNDIFYAIAFKELRNVDLPNRSSHQHELNGVLKLREFFSTSERISGTIHWIMFEDDKEPEHFEGVYTFYDARENNPHRTEWRMYYSDDFLSKAEPGDVLILAKMNDQDEDIFGLVFKNNSSWLRSAVFLFSLDQPGEAFQAVHEEDMNRELQFVKTQIINSLGIEYQIPVAQTILNIAEQELKKNKNKFPETKRVAELAWAITDTDMETDVDRQLLLWIEHETKLFYAMEKIIVQPRLDEGFSTVDEFIAYSLSVQNRRKTRMGYSFENHLEKLFTDNKIKFSAQARTEDNKKPDFLFPGEKEYHDPGFDASLLVMLGAKSSCKDRWRQVLDEADRIPLKHLCTLEQQISEKQWRQMKARDLTLVIPEEYHVTFSDTQRSDLWTVRMFIDFVSSKQKVKK